MLRPVTGGRLWSVAVAFALLAAADAGRAQQGVDAVGEVSLVQGTAVVMRGVESAPSKLAVRQPLFVGDRIETGDRSAVKALFRDDSLLTLG